MRPLLCRGLCVCLTLWAAVALLRGDPGDDERTKRIAELIRDLGDRAYAKREAATKSLTAFGEPVLPVLRDTLARGTDLETQRRAARIVRTILLASRKSKSTGLEMVVIDDGEFLMGSDAGERGRKPDETQHRVWITRPLLMGAYEVTQAEYRQVMKASPSWFAKTGGGAERVAGLDTDRFPVERVSWFDAVAFCNRLSELDGLRPYYKLTDVQRKGDSILAATVTLLGGPGYRLPTEAEWEYACRAGTTSPYSFGQTISSRLANVKSPPPTGYGVVPREDLTRTTTVGSYQPNGWGLYDMHGNVAEWCWDWYDRDYYAKSPKEDPRGPDAGRHRGLRGGSWLVSNGSSRSACRFWLAPEECAYYAGFRVCRSP